MDGQQLAWVIIICAFFICFAICSAVASLTHRDEIHLSEPKDDAPPEVWIAYYRAAADIFGKNKKD